MPKVPYFKCPLCTNEFHNEIAPDSHIISKHNFRHTGLANNQNLVLKSYDNNLKEEVIKSSKKIRNKSGITQSPFLCQKCEGLLNKEYEDYSAKLIYSPSVPVSYGLKNRDIISQDKKMYFEYSGVQYTTLKNYILSTLWKASVCNQKEFSNVNLGDIVNEDLRKIIYYQRYSEDNKYCIGFMACSNLSDEESKRMNFFRELNVRSKAYCWIFGRFVIEIKISDGDFHFINYDYRLRGNGVLPICWIDRSAYFGIWNMATKNLISPLANS